MSVTCSAQNVVTPWWGTPFPEGTISPGEWDAAPTVSVPTGTGQFCTVAVACDSWGLYLAFMDNLESAGRFPELLLDPAHDRTVVWNADDRWFHVSATACHHQGEYGVYDDCSPMPSDWSAHPIMNSGPPSTDAIEVAIPWWYLMGSTPQSGDTLGFGLVLTNTVNTWTMWPSGAGHLAPDSWGHLVIPTTTGVDEIQARNYLRVWPNPGSDRVDVGSDLTGTLDVDLRDAQGRVIRMQRATGPIFSLDISDLPSGAYVLVLHDRAGRSIRSTLLR